MDLYLLNGRAFLPLLLYHGLVKGMKHGVSAVVVLLHPVVEHVGNPCPPL